MFNYKPCLVQELLGIERSVFRYWRQMLDPKPNRNRFSYNLVVAYGVINFLIKKRGVDLRILRHFNTKEYFEWFSQEPNGEGFRNIVVELNVEQRSFSFINKAGPHSGKIDRTRYVYIDLSSVDDYLDALLKGKKIKNDR